MSLRRQLLSSFALQGAGSASVLLATLLLGASLGPEVQGEFSRTKAEIELIGALAMFGLPQSLFFYVKSGRLGSRAGMGWGLWSAALAVPIGALYALLQYPRGWPGLLLFGTAVGGFVAHGQLRGLLLVRLRTEWFNVVTALPQVLVLVGVGLVVWKGTSASFAMPTWLAVFAIAYGTAALVSGRKLNATREGPPTQCSGWRELGRYGLATWIVTVLGTAATLAAQRWVEGREGLVALGQFTMALTLVRLPLTPVTYAAPLLFRRWMEQPGARASRRWAATLFAMMLVAAALVWSGSSLWPDLGLGPAYDGTAHVLAILLAGGAAEAASRVLTAQASAAGRPGIAVRSEAARWSVLALGFVLPLPYGLLPICAVWALASAAAAMVFVLHAKAIADSEELPR